MRKKETVGNLCHYFLSQDNELDALKEDIAFNNFGTKKEARDYYKNSLYYGVDTLYNGSKLANQTMREVLSEIFN
jgi:hypothetical protein